VRERNKGTAYFSGKIVRIVRCPYAVPVFPVPVIHRGGVEGRYETDKRHDRDRNASEHRKAPKDDSFRLAKARRFPSSRKRYSPESVCLLAIFSTHCLPSRDGVAMRKDEVTWHAEALGANGHIWRFHPREGVRTQREWPFLDTYEFRKQVCLEANTRAERSRVKACAISCRQ
jgi:hypothetical protein